jgi:hypothetical protein
MLETSSSYLDSAGRLLRRCRNPCDWRMRWLRIRPLRQYDSRHVYWRGVFTDERHIYPSTWTTASEMLLELAAHEPR